MTIKEQLNKLKDNWLIVLLVVVLLGISIFNTPITNFAGMMSPSYGGGGYAESAIGMDKSAIRSDIYYPYPTQDFAPEEQDRLITRTASMSTEVKRGTFSPEEQKLKSIVKSSDSYLLYESVNKYGTGRQTYYYGSYNIKVETSKYDAVITQLRNIGEITSFNENANDITVTHVNLEAELEAAQKRLEKYEQMYNETTLMADKITLLDRITQEQSTIKYMQDALKNIDNQVSYSTIYFTMTEKQSEYINVVWVKFSELVTKMVNSLNNMLSLIFWAIPYAIAIVIIWLIVRAVRKKKKK
jgi:hypothetical protein